MSNGLVNKLKISPTRYQKTRLDNEKINWDTIHMHKDDINIYYILI